MGAQPNFLGQKCGKKVESQSVIKYAKKLNPPGKDTLSRVSPMPWPEPWRKNKDVSCIGVQTLQGRSKMTDFAKYPERFGQTGIAEANMIGIAAGMATSGKIPFAGTFAVFASGRTYDQIRLTVAYSNKRENCGFAFGYFCRRRRCKSSND